jgi:hypothetical protein
MSLSIILYRQLAPIPSPVIAVQLAAALGIGMLITLREFYFFKV